MSTKLGFMIAGAQKCGTTALHAYLLRHPDLQMSEPKELHFFDREDCDWSSPDYAELHRHFPLGDGRLRGEATPITLYWTPAHYRVFNYNPLMKFILLLRDPAERALSHWRMNIARGLDTMSFDRAIREGRSRVLDTAPQMGLARHSSYVERGFYGRQIALIQTLFPASNILALDHSDLEVDPDGLLRRVTDFLNVSPMDRVVPVRLNESDKGLGCKLAAEDRLHLDDLFRDDLELLKTLTGLKLTSKKDA